MASEIFCRARRADRPEEIEYLTSAAAAASAAVTSSGTASLGAAPLVGLSYDVGAASGFSVSLTSVTLCQFGAYNFRVACYTDNAAVKIVKRF